MSTHLAQHLDRHIIPPPRPDEEMLAEFQAMDDPSSGRDAVLVTPGARVPEGYGDREKGYYRINVQPYGFMLTTNKATAERLLYASNNNLFVDRTIADQIIGEALFQAAGAKGIPINCDVYVSAYNKDGVQISEVLADSKSIYDFSVAEAVMRSHAGPDGRVKVRRVDYEDTKRICREWWKNGGGVPQSQAEFWQ